MIHAAMRVLMFGLLVSVAAATAHGEPDVRFTPHDRGMTAETSSLRLTVHNGVVTELVNRHTGESYLSGTVAADAAGDRLPAGLGTQHDEAERAAAFALFRKQWHEHPVDATWPNQHRVTGESELTVQSPAEGVRVLRYRGLRRGERSFPDEVFELRVAYDEQTGDLLLTPRAVSPRAGVYGVALPFATLGPAITMEAPIFDGVRLDRHMGHGMWSNAWPAYWDYGLVALNGQHRGAVGLWAQDAEMRTHKHLFYLVDGHGLSFSLSAMNVPPFERHTEAAPMTWRAQAFDRGWPQLAERYRAWRDENVEIAERPDWADGISFVNSSVNAHPKWLENLDVYLGGEHLERTVTFLPTVREEGFDKNHTNNTPYAEFGEHTEVWKESGAKTMAYLIPVIMWSPKPENERQERGLELARQARTVFPFQPEGEADHVRYVDWHHLGHTPWQQWFLQWVDEYIQDYGADGIYHDMAYVAPMDSRGLEINNMTSPQGLADYLHKAQTRNPDSIHGTEHLTEPGIAGASLGIGSGIIWGPAPVMRHQRIDHGSPISSALHHPHGVIFGFPHFSSLAQRGDALHFHWGMDLMERRAEIPGQYLQNSRLFLGKHVPFDTWRNEFKLDRTRTLTFVRRGLRPVFPAHWDRDVRSYFQGKDGSRFAYRDTVWGSAFLELSDDEQGDDRLIYGRIHGVTAAATDRGAISGWPVYNDAGPTGLYPDRYYVLDPDAARPEIYFVPENSYGPSFYESYVERGFTTPSLAMIQTRTLEDVGAVVDSEKLILHAPREPFAVWVNGKLSGGRGVDKPEVKGGRQLRPVDAEDPAAGWRIHFRGESAVLVMMDPPPAGLDALADRAHHRLLSRTLHSEIVDPAWLGERLKEGAPGELDAVDVDKRAMRRATSQTLLPLRAPEGQAGRYVVEITGPRRGPDAIDEVLLNGVAQRVAVRRVGGNDVAELVVPLEAGEAAVVDARAQRGVRMSVTWEPEAAAAEGESAD